MSQPLDLSCVSSESPPKGGVVLSLADVTSQSLLVLSLHFLAQSNASFSVTVEFRDKKTEVVTVHYVCSDRLLQVKVGQGSKVKGQELVFRG